MAKLSVCRTAALGGHRYRCDDCETETTLYNSCGDRHCPQCAGARRADWVDSTAQLLLEGVEYYQVVFTLPDKLSALALGNRQAIYDLLFQASWQALRTTVNAEQAFDPAALMVLHTWNQELGAHAHVHALVPGGGPSLKGESWKRTERFGRPTSIYLVDESELRRVYREAFISGLRQLHGQGKLKLAGEFEELNSPLFWEAFLKQLVSTKWVVYIQPPPKENVRPETVVKYLGRYLTGGPISDRRLISVDDDRVTFWARAATTAGGDRRQVPVSLPAVEFVRRWTLHILPHGYTKSRRFGGWSNTRRQSYLTQCKELLGIKPSEAATDPLPCDDSSSRRDLTELDDAGDSEYSKARLCCPHCQRQMRPLAFQDKPSWRVLMNGPRRPAWYQRFG